MYAAATEYMTIWCCLLCCTTRLLSHCHIVLHIFTLLFIVMLVIILFFVMLPDVPCLADKDFQKITLGKRRVISFLL